jgi:hypothetical protein
MLSDLNDFVILNLTNAEIKLNNKLLQDHYVNLWYKAKIYNYKKLSFYIKNILTISKTIIQQLSLSTNLTLTNYNSLNYYFQKFIQEILFLNYINQNLLNASISFKTYLSTLVTKTFLLASDSVIVPSIYADAKPPIPNLLSNNWSFTNTVQGNKINWYFGAFDTIQSLKYQDLSSMFFIIQFSSIVSKPYLTLYTINTQGTGWYGSKKTFVQYTCEPNKWILVYWGQDPTLNPSISSELRSFDQKVAITFDPTDAQAFVSKVGATDLNASDLIYLIAFSTNSAASASTVNFEMKQFGYQTTSTVELFQLICQHSSFLN